MKNVRWFSFSCSDMCLLTNHKTISTFPQSFFLVNLHILIEFLKGCLEPAKNLLIRHDL